MDTQVIISTVAITIAIIALAISIILYRHYSRLTKNVSQKDLLSSLNRFISISEKNTEDVTSLTDKLNSEIQSNKLHFQRIGFKRYNPFSDTGGDQSFALALLDDLGDGIVISSLHSRENTRLYAKKVVKGETQDQLTSREEAEVIKLALK